MRSGLLVFSPPAASRARCSPRDPEGVVGSTSRGWKWVGLGVEMGGVRWWRWVGLGICKVGGVRSEYLRYCRSEKKVTVNGKAPHMSTFFSKRWAFCFGNESLPLLRKSGDYNNG